MSKDIRAARAIADPSYQSGITRSLQRAYAADAAPTTDFDDLLARLK